jgi:hypothetical protein
MLVSQQQITTLIMTMIMMMMVIVIQFNADLFIYKLNRRQANYKMSTRKENAAISVPYG